MSGHRLGLGLGLSRARLRLSLSLSLSVDRVEQVDTGQAAGRRAHSGFGFGYLLRDSLVFLT